MSRGCSRSGGRFGGRSYLAREDVDSSDVVHEDEVTLDGSVPGRSMRYLIEDVAASHPAVQDIDNRIRVRRP